MRPENPNGYGKRGVRTRQNVDLQDRREQYTSVNGFNGQNCKKRDYDRGRDKLNRDKERRHQIPNTAVVGFNDERDYRQPRVEERARHSDNRFGKSTRDFIHSDMHQGNRGASHHPPRPGPVTPDINRQHRRNHREHQSPQTDLPRFEPDDRRHHQNRQKSYDTPVMFCYFLLDISISYLII